MIVRIRLNRGRPIQRQRGKNRDLAFAFGALLVPASLMAYVLGIWRLASDMGMAGAFGIKGLFSHWQIWMVSGLLLQAAASSLNHYGRDGDLRLPRVLWLSMFLSRHPKDTARVERAAIK
jgi:hypothetical protein